MYKITYWTYNNFKSVTFCKTKEQAAELVKNLRQLKHVTKVSEPEALLPEQQTFEMEDSK